MKKLHLLLTLLALLTIACGKKKSSTSEAEQKGTKKEAVKPETSSLARDPRKIGPAKSEAQKLIETDIYKIDRSDNPLFGYWVGAFGKNKINIALAGVVGDSIFGHSVCAGNFRSIKGTYQFNSDSLYEIHMAEPGDDQYDGLFDFTVDVANMTLTGRWTPYKSSTSAKEYQLVKTVFYYNPEAGEYPETSTEYLDPEYAENLLPEEIEYRRNEIYARHGYSFQNLKIRRVFDEKLWYVPMSVDIRDQLTEMEAHNIDMMYNYEEYYDEYYDSYGR